MFFELPWVGVAMDAMAVAIHIKYALSLNPHITFYFHIYQGWRVTKPSVKSANESIDPVPQLSREKPSPC